MLKTKLLLPLILILCLTFTLSGYSADLYGTYDQRIKLTVSNTNIDAELTWFPLTVFLDSGQGEEVFAEFDADADFDRVAFTTSDGSTQVYADCERFDDSASVAEYHIAKTGVAISNSGTTDFYMYYDNDAAHNTTYISKSGGTAAQSVWDGDFEAVYHMNDPTSLPDFYDTEYDGSVEPDSDGWTLGGTDHASSDGDILTIDTSADASWSDFYYKQPDVDFNAGFYAKFRLQTDGTDNELTTVYIRDGTQNETVRFDFRNTKITYIGSGSADWTTSTSDAYHIYEVYILATNCKIYKDGVLGQSFTVKSASVTDIIIFGDYSAGEKTKCTIDYFYYALGVAQNPVGILDSTSNTNYGTKKATGEPVEATGKVGQGQDFDGTDDCIALADDSFEADSVGTIEAIIERDTAARDYDAIFSSFETGSGAINFTVHEDLGYDLAFQHNVVDPASNDLIYGDVVLGTTARHVAVTSSGSAWALYVDGTGDAENVLVGSNSGDWFAELPVATNAVRIGTDSITHFFDGIIDEFRYSSSTRNAAWIKATYNSLWDTLITYGSEETETVSGANILFIFGDF